MVTMKLQTTFRATVFALCQCLFHPVAAAATFLRCVRRGYFPDSFRSFFRFRLKCLDESSPRGVIDSLGKMMVLDHPFYVQVFNGNFVILPQEVQRFFMREVLALPLHFQMLPRLIFRRFPKFNAAAFRIHYPGKFAVLVFLAFVVNPDAFFA